MKPASAGDKDSLIRGTGNRPAPAQARQLRLWRKMILESLSCTCRGEMRISRGRSRALELLMSTRASPEGDHCKNSPIGATWQIDPNGPHARQLRLGRKMSSGADFWHVPADMRISSGRCA